MNPDELSDCVEDVEDDYYGQLTYNQTMSHNLDDLLAMLSGATKTKKQPAPSLNVEVVNVREALARATRMLHDVDKKLMNAVRVNENGQITFDAESLEDIDDAFNYVKGTFSSFSESALSKFFKSEADVLKTDSMLLRFCFFTPAQLEIISAQCSTRAMAHLEKHSLQVKQYNEISKV